MRFRPAPMSLRARTVRLMIAASFCYAAACAEVSIAGRVVDENGIGVGGARIELHSVWGAPAVASSDPAGNFRATLPGPGNYAVRVERAGFFLYANPAQ